MALEAPLWKRPQIGKIERARLRQIRSFVRASPEVSQLAG